MGVPKGIQSTNDQLPIFEGIHNQEGEVDQKGAILRAGKWTMYSHIGLVCDCGGRPYYWVDLRYRQLVCHNCKNPLPTNVLKTFMLCFPDYHWASEKRLLKEGHIL